MGYSINLTKKKLRIFLLTRAMIQNMVQGHWTGAIQKYLEDVLAEEILSGNLKKGESVIADFDSKSKSIFIAKSHNLKSK